MQCNIREGIVLFGVLLLSLSTFISVKHMVIGLVKRVSTSMYCLLCLLVLIYVC